MSSRNILKGDGGFFGKEFFYREACLEKNTVFSNCESPPGSNY